uniref:C3H1-type domain-containing protein n=1 Tax=Ascaris lumbricoides TaxID=6252 RepID=A0A9J2PAX4_ASCLU
MNPSNGFRSKASSNDTITASTSSKIFGNLRTQQGRLSKIAVLEVNRENITTIWPYLLISIRNASFISLDLELSGLGIRKGWSSQSLEDRYQVIRESARSRAILSIGISIFRLLKRKETDQKKRVKYQCQVFNILSLCAAPFVVEPDGLQFLARHKFDFNRLINLGVSYGGDTARKNGCATYDTLKALWEEILSASVPITLHNGIVDLAFIYQHFYSNLPETLVEFLANICDWFTLDESGTPGLFDSKYLAEYSARLKASYLEYVFRKCQRDNAIEASSSRAYISIEFDDLPLSNDSIRTAFDVVDCQLPNPFLEAVIVPNGVSERDAELICKKYATFGFCNLNEKCNLMHNVDLVLDLEEQKQLKLRRRRKHRYDYASKGIRIEDDRQEERAANDGSEEGDELLTDKSSSIVTVDNSKVRDCSMELDNRLEEVASRSISDIERSAVGCHRAGVDSFMTGFSVIFMSRMNVLRKGCFNSEEGNRLPLRGKPIPLIIRKSEFTKRTEDHSIKWERIEKERSRIKHLRTVTLNS